MKLDKRIALALVLSLLATAACVCTSLPADLAGLADVAGDFEGLQGTLESPGFEATLNAVATEAGGINIEATVEAELGGDISIGDGEFVQSDETTFPLPDDYSGLLVFNFDTDTESAAFQSTMSVEDLRDFYRNLYLERGFTENESMLVDMGNLVSMEFEGDASAPISVVILEGDEGSLVTINYRQ